MRPGRIGVAALFCAVAGFSVCAAEGRFEPVPVEHPLATMALTEKGDFLLCAHVEENQITVWDVVKGTLHKTVSCPSPYYMLCRQGKIYVANGKESTITVLDPGKEWKPVDQLDVGGTHPHYLSAPGGKYFKGMLLVTCQTPDDHSSLFVVDATRDEFRKLSDDLYPPKISTFSFDGKSVVTQQLPGGSLEYHDAATYLGDPRRRGKPGAGGPTLYQQMEEGQFWVGSSDIRYGSPPRHFVAPGASIFPDNAHAVVYFRKRNTVTAHRVDAAMTSLGTFSIEPKQPAMMSSMPKQWKLRSRNRTGYLAATHGDRAYLFACSHQRKPLRCVVSLEGRNIAGERPVAPSGAGSGEFPKTVVAGTPVEYTLRADGTERPYTVVQGPKSIRVSSTGVLSWTPGDQDIGTQRIKVRVKVGEKTEFIRLETEVISGELAARVGGDTARLANKGKHYFLKEISDLRTSVEGDEIVVLAHRELRILDRDGLTVLRKTELPQPFIYAALRDDRCLCLRHGQMTILDRETLKPKQRIELPGTESMDLALHPRKPVSFVATFDEGEKGKRPPERPMKVLRIDEPTGEVEDLPDVYATRLLVHPRGTCLYAFVERRLPLRFYDMFREYRGQLDSMRTREHPRVIALYGLGGDVPVLQQFNYGEGWLPKRVWVSPAGDQVFFYEGAGRAPKPIRSRLTAFPADDIRTTHHTIRYEELKSVRDISLHPVFGWMATCTTDAFMMYARTDGAHLTGKVDTEDAGLKRLSRVLFTPGATHLLIAAHDRMDRRLVGAFPLNLTDEEKARLEKARVP